MSAQVNLISTRPNTNAEFWWTTTDQSVSNLRNQVLAVATQMNIPNTVTVSENQLVCTTQYVLESEAQWQQFTSAISGAVPGLVAARNGYYAANGHTLKLEAVDPAAGTLLKEINIFPQ